jgi:transcription elongation factor GreA
MDEETEDKIVYQIVGEDEADIKAGRLSIDAPLARSLVGKIKGDVLEVVTPRGHKSYEILGVSYV